MLSRLGFSKRIVRNLFVMLALASVSLGAYAQPGGRGPGLSPEDRAKIGAAQATIVAADLKLDAEKTQKFVAAYEAFQKEASENRPEFGRGDWEAMRKHVEEQQAKLATSLKAVVDEAQAKEAASVLGGFNRGWDRMVAVLLGFELGAEKEPQALAHTLTYVKAGNVARENSSGDDGFGELREAMAAAKKSLDESLAPLLSEEQKAKWLEATSWRGDRGDRGRGEGRDRGEGGDRGNRGGER